MSSSPVRGADPRKKSARDPSSVYVLVGVIPRLPEVVVPSRHLGLIPVAERRPAALEAVAALSLMARKYLDLRQRRGRVGNVA